ncbi:MAG: UvrD-helicase domain-containing protein, partial [Clostridia bacterium]|nr:UvrD-helicase domain-containing protein [Clostridia bacterium]
MPEFTVEQRRAIEERGSNLLLSAAAGSGKTTVLVERVLSRIERDRASIDRMLVVTFTRAAAQDMRAKLSERFTWRASQPDALPIYREQLNRLERASITTLHAFCAEFLRAHFEAAGVDPAFQVLDDAVQERLLEEALDEALEEAYAEADEAMLTLDDGRGPAQVRALLERLCRFLEERPQPERWLEAATDMDRVALWTRELVFSARRVLAQARLLLRQATELAGCTPQYLEAMR